MDVKSGITRGTGGRPFATLAALVLGWLVAPVASADSPEELTSLSLEQLMNEPVTSVAKTETRLGDAAAAITVITQDDLRRMGITTLAEALRLVPGMDVARIASGQWAVSARGFTNEYATKLLVLIDGRTIYSPTDAGVFWNSQDTVIEDIDRIEVIKGPGATLWGSNAVNGVINVITKRASDTQGLLLSALAGTEDRPQLTARYGGTLGGDLDFRVYAKYFTRDGFPAESRDIDAGDWHTVRGGFRMDWKVGAVDDLTVQGEAYDGESGRALSRVEISPPSVTNVQVDDRNSGANALGRWTHATSATSGFALQTYVDRVLQGYGLGVENRDTYDIDFQHHFSLSTRNDVIWGTGYRYSTISEDDRVNTTWFLKQRVIGLANAFVEDQVTLVPERLRATFGSKFERSDISGWSVEPTARLAWTPSNRQSVWAAASRATRTPALFEIAARSSLDAFSTGPNSPPVLFAVIPNPHLRSERVVAYELGYRLAVGPRVTLDLASFLNRYTDGIYFFSGPTGFETTPSPPHVLTTLTEKNQQDARTYGVETSLQWQVLSNWKLSSGYTWIHMDVWPDLGVSGASPHGQVQIRSYVDLPLHVELNAALYHVSRTLQSLAYAPVIVPGYTRADVGLVWQASPELSLGVWGQNLFDRRHVEEASIDSGVFTEVPQTYLVKLTWSH